MLTLILYTLALTNEYSAIDVARVEYCASISFRETPFADINCARELAPDAVGDRQHFQLAYDEQGRLTEVSFRQREIVRDLSARFVRAPVTRITYEPGLEIRQFYDHHGSRRVVSGDVYETRFTLNAHGERLQARFHGVDGKAVEDHFGIARYAWSIDPRGVVTERRFDLEGQIVRNRPGFGYLVTKFFYDADGLLRRMENWGEDGQGLTADSAGIVATEIRYNEHGQFTVWLNLDENNQPRRGMSEIAEIRYDPGVYASEKSADFIDADGTPQSTRWGAYRVETDHDEFGNPVETRFKNGKGQIINVNSGIGIVRSRWTEDGTQLIERSNFNAAGDAVEQAGTGIHVMRNELDDRQRITQTGYFDLSGEPVVNPGSGYASVNYAFDQSGRQISMIFTGAAGEPVNHANWGFHKATFVYDGRELRDVQYVDTNKERVQANWNPDH